MANINLLPTDLGPDPQVAKVSEKLVRFVTFLTACLVILIIVSIASFELITRKINETNTNKENLKASISSLETTEQKLILIKDRIDKSSTVISEETASKQIEEIEGLITSVPSGVTIVQSEVFPQRTEIVFSVPESKTVGELVQLIESTGRFRIVQLKSIEFSNKDAYKLGFVLIN
ncbi:hypothetical protein IPM62_02960 [Candidatus Woesebacteria bacterium]|nr:MAG: hypothetical protein IPM62_02960 [Candidatus Woesebacteria bacterium]